MFGAIKNLVRGRGRTARRAAPAAFLLLMVCMAGSADAYMDKENPLLDLGYNPNGVFIIDGSYVMNVGEVQINITNWGLIGSTYSWARPWSDAPSCQWPAGSGNEYLWSSGLWVGGVDTAREEAGTLVCNDTPPLSLSPGERGEIGGALA